MCSAYATERRSISSDVGFHQDSLLLTGSTRNKRCQLSPRDGNRSTRSCRFFGHIPYLQDAENMQVSVSSTALPAPSAVRNRTIGMECQICGPSAGEPALVPTGDRLVSGAPVGDAAADVDLIEDEYAEAPPRRRTNALQREAKTVRHMAIHRPYNPHCQICRDAMARRRN